MPTPSRFSRLHTAEGPTSIGDEISISRCAISRIGTSESDLRGGRILSEESSGRKSPLTGSGCHERRHPRRNRPVDPVRWPMLKRGHLHLSRLQTMAGSEATKGSRADRSELQTVTDEILPFPSQRHHGDRTDPRTVIHDGRRIRNRT